MCKMLALTLCWGGGGGGVGSIPETTTDSLFLPQIQSLVALSTFSWNAERAVESLLSS